MSPAIFLPAGFIVLRAERPLLAVTHRLNAVLGDSRAHQKAFRARRTAVSEATIVLFAAALIAVAFEGYLDLAFGDYSRLFYRDVTLHSYIWHREILAMNGIFGSLANTRPSQPEVFDRLLRRAAAYCWLARFEQQLSKGAFTVGYLQIGETAGRIWETLSREGPLTFAALMEEVDAPQSLFFMAIGWLSREDKVHFERADGDYIVRLA